MMKTEKQLSDIVMKIYKALYAEATPKANFVELYAKGVTNKQDWFNDYYLDIERQKEIIENFCKAYHLSRMERAKVMTTVMLGCSPVGHKSKEFTG